MHTGPILEGKGDTDYERYVRVPELLAGSFVLAFIIAAVVTPTPDMVTQTMLALPIIGLYLIGVAVAYLFGLPRWGSEQFRQAAAVPTPLAIQRATHQAFPVRPPSNGE